MPLTVSDKTRRRLVWTGCVVVGLVFVAAAAAKFTYVLPLERDLMDVVRVRVDALGRGGRLAFAVWARLLIALELALGLALLQPFGRRRFVLPLSIAVLAVFAAYLAKLVVIDRSTANCGCFGALVPLAPLPSLAKTVGLLALSAVLRRFAPPDPPGRLAVPAAIAGAALVVVFAAVPPTAGPTAPPGGRRFAAFREFHPAGTVDLTRGVRLVAFLSLDCADCQRIATELADWANENPPVYLVLTGKPGAVEPFLAATGADYPWLRLADERVFFDYIGNDPPRVYLLQDGREVRHWDRDDFSVTSLRDAWRQVR